MGNPYLVLYNVSLFSAWGYVLYLTYNTFMNNGSTSDVYKVVEVPLKIAQTAAILEVVHSAIGLVKSPVGITAMQVASRLWIVWGIIELVPGPTTSGAVKVVQINDFVFELNLITLLTAWSLSELIRYSFYAIKELGMSLYLSTWLRYSGFIVLYPLGVASELAMAWLALPTIKEQQLWTIRMPNKINFAFDYYVVVILTMIAYLPGLPQLYGYLLSQRKKVLGGKGASKTKSQ